MARRSADDFAADMAARKQAEGATPVALNTPRVKQERDVSDDRLEAIAEEIEATQKIAIWHVGEQLAEAHGIFRYRRDEGGFGGWVEARLRLARSTAYDLLHVHERFGDDVSERLDTFAPSVLYLLAAPSTPDAACEEVFSRAEAGEQLSVTAVKNIIAGHKLPQPEEVPAGAGDDGPDVDVHDIGHDGSDEDEAQRTWKHVGLATVAKPKPTRGRAKQTEKPQVSKITDAAVHRRVKLDEDHGGGGGGGVVNQNTPPNPPAAVETPKISKTTKRSILKVWEDSDFCRA